jgi:putative copper export protein
MTAYGILKAIHVLAAIVWVGGGITMFVLAMRMVRSQDAARVFSFVRDLDWMGKHVYLPASMTVLVFGILTALQAHLSFRAPWLVLGFLGLVATASTGTMFFLPEGKRIISIGEQRGPDDPEVRRRITRLVGVARVDLVVLLLVVVDMVLRP